MEEGFYKDGVYYYQGLPDDLDKLTKYDAIKDLISPPLSDDQSIDLLKALLFKRFAAFYATGLGKTYLATAYVRALKNKNPDSKIILFVKKSQEDETPSKISGISGLRCAFFDASKKKFINEEVIENNDIIMMTHDTLNSEEHMSRLLLVIGKINGIIIDEAHLLSNLEGANSAFMLYAISHEVEYVLALTATPITTEIEQLTRILKIIAPADVDNFKKLGSELKRFGLGALPPELNDLFVIRDRIFNNHVGIAQYVEAMPHQVGADGKDLFVITKGPGAFSQANEVVNLVNERKPLRGIIYCNRKIIQGFLVDYLNTHGVVCGLVNGETSKSDRKEIINEFKSGGFDILVTNIKEALDMDCDYVIFYEFTPHIKQVIGRAERGLNPKPLDIIFLFTRNTGEVDSFNRNVFEISQEVQEILGIDFREITNMQVNRIKSSASF